MKTLIQKIKDFFDTTIRVKINNELDWLEIHLCGECIEPFTTKDKRKGVCIDKCKPLKKLREKYDFLTKEEKEKIIQGNYKEVL